MNEHIRALALSCGMGAGETNGYIVVSEDGASLAIVDPAGDFGAIARAVDALGARPVAVLLTHAHFDHVLALRAVKAAYGIPAYLGAGDEELLRRTFAEVSGAMGEDVSATADVLLRGGETLDIAGYAVRAIATPGHSAGSMCYAIDALDALLSGDTLFRGSVGRTDFGIDWMRGDFDALMGSLRALARQVGDDVDVLPGHGPATTMGEERRGNSFVRRAGA